jgi:hypothetical protein
MKRLTTFGLASLSGLVLASWLVLPTNKAAAQTSPPACATTCVSAANSCRDNKVTTFIACEVKCRNATPPAPTSCFEACADGLTSGVQSCADTLSGCVQAACKP